MYIPGTSGTSLMLRVCMIIPVCGCYVVGAVPVVGVDVECFRRVCSSQCFVWDRYVRIVET